MEREDKRVKNGQINADGLHSGRCPSQERTAVHWPQGSAAEGESHEDEKTLPVRTLSEIHENAIFEQLVGIKEAQRKWIENSRSFGHRRSSGQRDSIKDVTDKFNNLSPRKSQIQDRPRLFCQEIFTDDKSVKASGDLTSNKPPPKKSIITPTGSSFGFCNVPHLKLHPSPVTATTFEPVTKPDKEYISEDGKLVKVLKIEEPNQTTSRPNKEKNPKKTKLVDTSVRLTNDPPVKKAQLVSDVKKFEINPINIISKVETDQPKLIPSLDDSTNSLITKLNQEIKKVSELVEQTKKLPKRCETAQQPEPVKKTPKKGKSSLGISTKKVTPEKENVLKANTPKQKKYDLKVTRNFIKQKKKEREERNIEEKKRKVLESEERKKKLLELKETQRKILQTCKRRVIQDKPQWIGPLEVVPKEKKEIKIPTNRRSRGPGTVTFAAAMGLHKVPAVVPPNVRNKRQLFMDYNNPNNAQRIIRQNTEIIRRNRPVDIPNKGDYKYAEDPVHPDSFLMSTSDEISSLKTCKSESALKSSDTSFVNYTYIDCSKNFPTVQSEQNSSQKLTNGNQKRIKSNSLSPLDPLKNVDQALKGEKRLRLNYTEDSKASLKLPMTKFLEAVPWESPLNENLDRPRTPFWLKDLSEDPDPFNLINTFKRKLQLLEGEDRKERDSVQIQQNVQDLNVHNFALDMASIPHLTDRTSKLATTTENFINSLPQLNFCDATYNVKELTSPNKIGKELVNLSADKINKYSLITSMPEKQSMHVKKAKSKSATRAKKQQMVPEADIIKPQISKSDTSLALATPLKLSDSLEGLNLRYQKLITGETIPQKDDVETDKVQQKASKDSDSKASPTKCEKKKSSHKKERTSKKNVLVRASSEEFPSKPDELSKHSSKQKGTSTTSVNQEINQDPNGKDNNVIETICSSAQSENYATLSEYSSNQSGNNMNANNQGFSTYHGNYSCMAGMTNDETNKSHMHIGYCSNHRDFYPVCSDYSSTGVNYSKYMINMSPYGNVPSAGQYVYPQNVGAYSMNNANIAVCSASQQDMYSYSQMAGYVPAMYQSMSGSYGTTPAYMAGSSGTAAHAAPIPTAIVAQTPVMITQESAAGPSQDVNTTLPVIMTAEKAAKAREKIIQKVYSESIFSDNSSDSVSEMVQLSRTLTRGNTVINNELHRVTSQSVKAKAETDGISEIMEVTSLRSSIHDPPFDFEEGSSIDKNITFTSIETYSPNTFEERPLEMKIAKITSQFDEPNDSRTAEQNYRSLNSYETSLIKKAKACIEEMESRRLKLIGKGKDSEASILKKKERALMLKLYEDLKEIFRLRKLEKSTGKNKKTKEDLMQVVPSQLKKDLAKVIPSSNMKGDSAESPDLVLLQTSRQLKEKEELLKERKKNVEAIVAWKQKLEQEERRVREMESLIARSPFNAPIQTFASFPCTIDRGTSPLGLEMPIENLGQGENVKQLCLMDSDNQNEYSDSFEMSSGLSEHTMKNVTVRSRHSSRVQYKRKPMTILKSPLSPRVTILKRRYSTGSDESITLSQNDTLSEQSDMEIRVSALQHQLKQRKNELEKLRKEYHKSQRERLRAKEQSLISQIHAYDSYIEQVKNELQNELEKPDVKVTKPQIKQPKYNEKKKSDASKITSASSEVVSSVTSQVEQTSKISEVKEEKPTPEIAGSLEYATSTKSQSSVPEQISAQAQEVIDIAHQMITSGSPVSDISTVFTQSQTKTSMQEISEHVEQATLPTTNPESDLKEITENIPSSIPSKSSSSPTKEVSENLDASFATKSEAEISERIEIEEDTSEETIMPEVKESSVRDETKAGIEESHMSGETKESNGHNTEVKTASSFKAIHDISTSPTNQTTMSSMIPTESKFRSHSPESHTATNIISELIGSYGTETGSGRFSSISPESMNNLDEVSEHLSKKSNDTNDQKFHSKASSSDTPTCIPSEESKTKPTESVKTLTPEKSPQSNVKSISEQLEKDPFLSSLRESLSEYSPTFQTEEGSKRTISQFLEEKHSPSQENKSFTLSSGEMSVASSYTNVDHEFDEVETASENKNQQSQSVFSVPEELSTIQPNLSQSSPGKRSDEKSVAASSPPSFPATKSLEISEAIAEESGKDNHEEIEEVYDESLSVESETEVIDSLDDSSSHSSKRFSDQGEANNFMEVANDVKTNPRERLSEEVFDLIHNPFELSDKLWKENMEQYEKNPEETPLLSALQRERQQNVNVDYIIQVICTNIIHEATDAAIAAFDRKKNFIYSQAESFPLAENEGITVGRNEKNNDEDVLWHGEGLMPQAVKEAQELRLKQLQIEQEIEKLEAQEVAPYYYVREIPNKPPPPYTPPKHSPPTKEETLSRLSRGVEIIWDEESKGNDPASVQMPESFLSTIQDHSYREFMFDLAKETFLKFKPRPEAAKPPWVVAHPPRKPLPPIRTKADLLKFVNKEGNIIFGYEPKIIKENMIMRWTKKRRDLVDEILVKELQEEEGEWTNFSYEENLVKNQIADSLMETMVAEASHGIAAAFMRKFPNVDAPS